MSGTLPANEPTAIPDESPTIELEIEARPRDVAGFPVRRVLPSFRRRRIGPFTFFDHIGPAELDPGEGFDVPPHPHIGLATVTYLFTGEVDHRDSLGTCQPIVPGDVNWMIAGRGIAHSERSNASERGAGAHVHGIQSWVAIPIDHEDDEPRFEHHPKSTLPRIVKDGVTLDVIAGTAYGERSPVGVLSPTLYVHALFEAGARLDVDDEHEERALYVVEGSIREGGRAFGPGMLLVLRPGAKVAIEAAEPSRVMLLGGAKLEGDRFIWWNFVSSSKDRIERAKADWKEGRFAKIPGDEIEFVPLPERG